MIIKLYYLYVLYSVNILDRYSLNRELQKLAKKRIKNKIARFHRQNPMCTCVVESWNPLPGGYEALTVTMFPVKSGSLPVYEEYSEVYDMPIFVRKDVL